MTPPDNHISLTHNFRLTLSMKGGKKNGLWYCTSPSVTATKVHAHQECLIGKRTHISSRKTSGLKFSQDFCSYLMVTLNITETENSLRLKTDDTHSSQQTKLSQPSQLTVSLLTHKEPPEEDRMEYRVDTEHHYKYFLYLDSANTESIRPLRMSSSDCWGSINLLRTVRSKVSFPSPGKAQASGIVFTTKQKHELILLSSVMPDDVIVFLKINKQNAHYKKFKQCLRVQYVSHLEPVCCLYCV